MTAPTHTPSQGATAYGSHYFGLLDRCERKWWLSTHAPHPHGGVGLGQEFVSRNLLLGRLVHEATAVYYKSSPTDPTKRSVDQAIATLEAVAASSSGDWRSPEEREEDIAKGKSLLYDYHHFWKGDPEVEVLLDDQGQPIVERELVVPLTYDGLVFTCRPDLVCLWQGRWVYVMEHKTSSVYSVNGLRADMRVSIQGSGECLAIAHHFPKLACQGVLLNIMLKDRSAKSKFAPFERDTATRTQAQLDSFRNQLVARHRRIQHLMAEYEDKAKAGDPWAAGRDTFIPQGMSTGACSNTYGRPCEFLDLCVGVGHEQLNAMGYRARNIPPTAEDTNE